MAPLKIIFVFQSNNLNKKKTLILLTLCLSEANGIKYVLQNWIYKKLYLKPESAQSQRKTCSSCDSSFQQDAKREKKMLWKQLHF